MFSLIFIVNIIVLENMSLDAILDREAISEFHKLSLSKRG